MDELTEVFETMDFGENHSVLVSGLRGSGKTSMLLELQRAASDRGWLVIGDDASSGLMDRIMETTIPTIINTLDEGSKLKLKSVGIWNFNATWDYVDRKRDVRPQLRSDLVALSNAIDGRGILVTIDEVSSGTTRLRELSKVALQVSHALGDGANIMIVFAGVKVDLDELLKQDHTTFLRRSRDLVFRRLTPDQTKTVLSETIHIGGRTVAAEVVHEMARIAQGYPYLIQLVGDYAWRANSSAREITLADTHVALEKAVKAVMNRVISRVYLDLSEKDKEFVQAMAQDHGQSKISDIVDRMGVSPQYVQVYKNRLIDSGYVQSIGHGRVAFSLPYLDQYIKTLDSGISLTDASAEPDEWHEYPAPLVQ